MTLAPPAAAKDTHPASFAVTPCHAQQVAGEGLTSPVFKEDGEPLDWAAEVLLLTHEPLRRDMLEMQRALHTKHFGELPEGWRVRAFFRFFGAWCSLVSQQQAVEVAVHYDWLVAPSGKLTSEHRSQLLSYHRTVELELLAISRLEHKIIEELSDAGNWTTSEPWSECSQMLRERLNKLCSNIRMHLAAQEELLPDILRGHWGRVSPPQLVMRSLAAAKRAQAIGAKGRETGKLLMWATHYLHRRSPQRAKHLIGSLPFSKRMAVAFGRMKPHKKLLADLRCIIADEAPREQPAHHHPPSKKHHADDGEEGEGEDEDEDRNPEGTAHEKNRRAGMVNAVLAAANAQRVDVPLNTAKIHRTLAEHEDPLHPRNLDGNWVNKHDKVPDNLYKKIGVEKPIEPPRRL